MGARPDKCFATSLVLGSDGRYGWTDPAFTIWGGRMTCLDDADFRYLGKLINTSTSHTRTEPSEFDCRRLVEEKLRTLLDADTLTASAKIWLCHHFVATKLSWSLSLLMTSAYPLSKSCKPLPPNHSSGGSGFQSAPTLQSFFLVAVISVVWWSAISLHSGSSNSISSSACSNPPRMSTAESSLKIWFVDSPNRHGSSPQPEKRKSPKLSASWISRKKPLLIPPRRLLIILHRFLERYANG